MLPDLRAVAKITGVRLGVGGVDYGGWESVRVTRGVECVAGSFELDVSDRWAGQGTPWPIHEGDECTVTLNGATVITGYVDRRSLAIAAKQHKLSVAGRDRTGALVDCSAVMAKWDFANLPLLVLAQRLAQPFGIPVSLDPSVTGSTKVTAKAGKSGGTVTSAGKGGKLGGQGLPKPPTKFSIDPGESAWEILDRACRMAGVLPVSDGMGGLLLTRAGSARATTMLEEGVNLLACSAEYNASARYHRYIVMGQQQATDFLSGPPAAAVRGEATDAGVARAERVLLIRAESGVTAEQARVRAQWEANIRAARGDAIVAVVQGWSQGDGSIWPINARARVRARSVGIDGEMLIAQAVHTIDVSSGTVTELTLRRPDAYLPEPIIQKSGAGGGQFKAILG